MRGIVISDLHMFSARSRAGELMEEIHQSIRDADVLVLNGDTFDFRWSTLPSHDESVVAALRWLENLAARHSHCSIQVVLGNHDYCKGFIEGLGPLEDRMDNLFWHEFYLQLGDALFIHGDCADHKMTHDRLVSKRQNWKEDRKQKPTWLGKAYKRADRLGITAAVPKVVARPKQVAKRIIYYLEDAAPGLAHIVSDIYFGHTHLPLTDYVHGKWRFHNTGSGVSSLDFNMLTFDIDPADVEAA